MGHCSLDYDFMIRKEKKTPIGQEWRICLIPGNQVSKSGSGNFDHAAPQRLAKVKANATPLS